MVLNTLWEVLVWVVAWAGINSPHAVGCDAPYCIWPVVDEILYRRDCLKRGRDSLKGNFAAKFARTSVSNPWSMFTRWVQDSQDLPPSGLVRCLPPQEYLAECLDFARELEKGVKARLDETPEDSDEHQRLDKAQSRLWDLEIGYRILRDCHRQYAPIDVRYFLALAEKHLGAGSLKYLPPPAPLKLLSEPPPGYCPPKEGPNENENVSFITGIVRPVVLRPAHRCAVQVPPPGAYPAAGPEYRGEGERPGGAG